MKSNKELFSVGEASRKHGVSAKTLRYYDNIGLLNPSKRKEGSDYRYYKREDMMILDLIRYYQTHCGLTLDEIKENLHFEDPQELADSFRFSESKIEEQIHDLQVKAEDIRAWRLVIEEGISYLKAPKPISMRFFEKINTLSYYTVLGDCPESYWALEKNRPDEEESFMSLCKRTGQTTYGAIYCDFRSAVKRAHYEKGDAYRHMAIIPATFNGRQVSHLGGTLCISAIHTGEFEKIHLTYDKAFQWAKKHNIKLAGNSIERYLIDRQSTPDSSNFVTEILLPVLEEIDEI